MQPVQQTMRSLLNVQARPWKAIVDCSHLDGVLRLTFYFAILPSSISVLHRAHCARQWTSHSKLYRWAVCVLIRWVPATTFITRPTRVNSFVCSEHRCLKSLKLSDHQFANRVVRESATSWLSVWWRIAEFIFSSWSCSVKVASLSSSIQAAVTFLLQQMICWKPTLLPILPATMLVRQPPSNCPFCLHSTVCSPHC